MLCCLCLSTRQLLLLTPGPALRRWMLQFCQVVCKDAVYNTILHKHRRTLHKVAAALLQGQADKEAGNERDPVMRTYNLVAIQEELVDQWLKVVTGVVCKAQAFQYITAEDLLAASKAVHTRVYQLFSAGHWVEALRVQVRPTASTSSSPPHVLPLFGTLPMLSSSLLALYRT